MPSNRSIVSVEKSSENLKKLMSMTGEPLMKANNKNG